MPQAPKRSGRIDESKVEEAMISTAMNALNWEQRPNGLLDHVPTVEASVLRVVVPGDALLKRCDDGGRDAIFATLRTIDMKQTGVGLPAN